MTNIFQIKPIGTEAQGHVQIERNPALFDHINHDFIIWEPGEILL